MDKVLVLDFGGPYSQVLANCVRNEGVFSEILPNTASLERIRDGGYKAILLTGGDTSVNAPNASACDPSVLTLGLPVLGIGYGALWLAKQQGGRIGSSVPGQFPVTPVDAAAAVDIVGDFRHPEQVTDIPGGWHITASAPNCFAAVFENADRSLCALQFHPESPKSTNATQVLRAFLQRACETLDGWNIPDLLDSRIRTIREQVGSGQVLCALSGGVDSSVVAMMIHRAVGKQLTCIFVDHGLLRKNEADDVERIFREQFDINLKRIDARERFLSLLAGVTDPEKKRKIIGETFIRVFEEEAAKLGEVDFLAQGTIYPDIVESGVDGNKVVKSHHNVGGLPEHIQFKQLIEPLSDLFKDEVRRAGLALGLPESLVFRQPFPGPGLGVRVIGSITEEKLAILREADAIFREEIANAGLDRSIQQYFAIITDMRSVGVHASARTYDYTVALRAIHTPDFMSAAPAELPYELLFTVVRRITTEVAGVNRVVYDVTGKPPATIEWE